MAESKPAVFAAMGANLAIAFGKLFAGLITGSSAMLSEAGHSAADTVDQVFLLVGINLSDTPPDAQHPHGYGRETFFWSFLVAIMIFTAGSVFALYEGVRTLIERHAHDRTTFDLMISFGVLAGAAVFEGTSLTIATRTLLAEARRKGWSVRRFVRDSPDLTIKTVFFEDSAALVGLVFAAVGLSLSVVLKSEIWDGLASIAISILLAAVAWMIGVQSRHLLLGASANPETQQAIRRVLREFTEVDAVVRLLTTQYGIESVIVNGELELRRDLSTPAIEDLIERIDRRLEEEVPEVASTYWELRRRPK